MSLAISAGKTADAMTHKPEDLPATFDESPSTDLWSGERLILFAEKRTAAALYAAAVFFK